ncbi:hypothetical protein RND81_06G197900 [Saponaria officinalis]|uniref:Exostosin GT47 domain-containing protein n=1 Tax=Saponaria officinalis TaxID=3572 RepID=A0AAW1K8D5_SAPOF
MVPWRLRRCWNHLLCRKPPPLSMVPITLACVTTFLVLLYISFTTNNFVLHKNNNSSPTLPGFKQQQHELIISHELIINNNNIIPTHNEESSSTSNNISRTINDDHEDGPLFFNDTTSLPLLTLPLTIGSSIDKHVHDDNVYHDKEIFLQNYEEMKKNLKIYIYPHDKNDPFASSLLPVYTPEPGGNYASESYFKNVLFKSRFVTTNPSEADLFFLPFSIASLRHDRRVGVGGLQDFIKDYMTSVIQIYPYWNRTDGADHFYVACHSIGRMAMEKVGFVKSNAIQVVCSSSYFLANYYAHKDVCFPQIWPRHDEPLDLGLSKRKRLAFFAGAVNSPIRKEVLKAWQNDTSIFVHSGRMKAPYSEQLLGSKYCLHVKGFEVNTARIGDALFYGCVPVILADYYDLPFMDIVNWKSFSVIVTSSDISNLKKILTNISSKEYSKLQANVLKVRKHFQWNKSAVDFDAFYMVLYELWLRRSSIRLISTI